MNKIELQAMGVEAKCQADQAPLCNRDAVVYVKFWVRALKGNKSLCLQHTEELVDRLAPQL